MKRPMKVKANEEITTAPRDGRDKRCYSNYREKANLEFDPMKDLNLPSSYDEVLARFRKLQGVRAMEALN